MPNRRQSLLLLGAGLATAPSASATAQSPSQPLKLRLPFSSFNKDHERHLNLSRLFFVITNMLSRERWGVWEDWCSWGWYSPKVVIDIRDRRYEFAKRGRQWKRNFPDPYYLEPDNHYILPVNLFGGDWTEPIGFNILPDVEATVSISFTISGRNADQYKVWAGTLEYQTKTFLHRE